MSAVKYENKTALCSGLIRFKAPKSLEKIAMVEAFTGCGDIMILSSILRRGSVFLGLSGAITEQFLKIRTR